MKKYLKWIVTLLIVASIFGVYGCKQESEPISIDKIAPANIGKLEIVASNGTAILSWTNPSDSDFSGVELSMNPATSSLSNSIIIPKDSKSFSISGLTNGKEYTFTVKSVDTSGNKSGGVTKSVTVEDTSDKTPPAEVTNIGIVASNENAILSWTNPTDEDFFAVQISMNPAEGTLKNPVILGKDVENFVVSGLKNEKEYTFTIKTLDESVNFSAGKSETVIVEDTSDRTAPAEVSNLEIIARNGNAILSWINPTDGDLSGIQISMNPTEGTLTNTIIFVI